MELHEIVEKLTGPIEPVGETRADESRLANLEAVIKLTDRLINITREAALSKDSYQYSVKEIGLRAQKSLDDLRRALNEDAEG